MTSELEFITTVLLGLLALGLAAYLVTIFNSLVQLGNNIAKAWSNIDVLLLQRNEEIGKLIELTRAYVPYEAGSLDTLTRLRTRYRSARRTERKTLIENELMTRMQGLESVWEAYPDLKANETFLQLQARISALEAAIADRRTFFNETVQIYNVQRERFPQLLFASALGFRAHPYLDLSAGRR
jgi:LemA protein